MPMITAVPEVRGASQRMLPESWLPFKSTGRLWVAMQVPGAHGLQEVEEIHCVDGQKAGGGVSYGQELKGTQHR